jgi:hypothetical protein
VAGAPAVALRGEAVGRLTEQRRLPSELLDACPGGCQLLLNTGHVPFGVGQPSDRIEGLTGGVGASEPTPVHSSGLVELAPGAIVHGPGVIGSSNQPSCPAKAA